MQYVAEADVSALGDRLLSMGHHTHLVEYDGGVLVEEISSRSDISTFAAPLHRFNGKKPWALSLAPLPSGMEYADMVEAGIYSTEYLQAAGSSPEKITIEIREPGGQQWGADWVRYVVGHPGSGDERLDVACHGCPASMPLIILG